MVEEEFSRLEDSQKSSLNNSVLRLISRDMPVKEYLDYVSCEDCILPALGYLYLVMSRNPDICEVEHTAVKTICIILNNAWAVHSSGDNTESLDDGLIPFYIMKCCDLLYSLEKDPRKAMLVGTRRRSLLIDIDWKKSHLSEYTDNLEFWLKMISLNIQLFTNDAVLLRWASSNSFQTIPTTVRERVSSRSSIDQTMNEPTSNEGIFDVATLALAGVSPSDSELDTPTSITNRLANECSMRDTCRWMILAGYDINRINKLCKKASLKFHLKSTLIHEVLISLEDCFLWHDRMEEGCSKVVVDRQSCLANVFNFLTAAEGLNFTLVSRQFRVAYRLPYLRNVLQRCSFSQPIRLSIWMQFVGGVVAV